MIGKIKGILLEVEGNIGLIETPSGLSYEVYLTTPCVGRAILDNPISLYTHFHVREDLQVLFGFESKNEMNLFKLLLSVSGVGPKTAFSVISFAPIDEFIRAVRENDADFFAKVPGLGRKTALKIILELSQKLHAEFKLKETYLSDDDKTVIDALVSLGFRAADARKILDKIDKSLPLQEKIRLALRKNEK